MPEQGIKSAHQGPFLPDQGRPSGSGQICQNGQRNEPLSGARVIWPLFAYRRFGDGELTQDLLYRPPIERKLSDEQSSSRLDTILADRNSDCHQPHDFALPLRMPSVGFAVLFGSGIGPGQIR